VKLPKTSVGRPTLTSAISFISIFTKLYHVSSLSNSKLFPFHFSLHWQNISTQFNRTVHFYTFFIPISTYISHSHLSSTNDIFSILIIFIPSLYLQFLIYIYLFIIFPSTYTIFCVLYVLRTYCVFYVHYINKSLYFGLLFLQLNLNNSKTPPNPFNNLFSNHQILL